MFHYYFRVFNWLCSLFGMKKPFLLANGHGCKITYWNKIWSVTVIATFITVDYVSIDVTSDLAVKKNLQNISDANDLALNIIIIIIDFFHGPKLWMELYETFQRIFNRLNLSNRNLKMFSLKLYVWFSLPTIILVTAIVMELFKTSSPQFVLLLKFPGYMATLHLVVHLHLVLAVLNVLNNKLNTARSLYTKNLDGSIYKKPPSMFFYIFDLNFNFLTIDECKSDFSLNFLCNIYDDLITCIKLLEKLHGKQILCTIWMMFCGAVIGATLISCEETKYPWMIISRSVLPLSWFGLCCFVDNQLRKEVEWTEIIIMKHMIDFKCDLPRKKILETFKQLVSTNRLEFTAGNLFHVNYSMILGTIMNVITYSIIMIQLFISS